MNKKWNNDNINELCSKINLQIINSNKMLKEKITLKDTEGFLYWCNIYRLNRGKKPRRFDKNNPYTIQNIKLWCKLNDKPFELVSDKYEGNDKKLKWKCLKENCGEIFEMNWNNIIAGQNCAVCAGQQVGISNCLATKNPELAADWHPTKNGDLTPYNITKNYSKKVWWQCLKNSKHIWKTSVHNRNYGNGCPYCGGRYATEDYNLLICNPELCEEWDYTKNNKNPNEYLPNSGKKAWWKCKDCGNKWEAIIDHRVNGSNCPECMRERKESFLQEKVRIFIELLNYTILHENKCTIVPVNPKTKRPLPCDNEIVELSLIIEVHGVQHYKHIYGSWSKNSNNLSIRKLYDRYKRIYAKSKGYHYLEIPYWTDDKNETWKKLITDKINEILHN